MKITLSLVLFWITIVHISDAVENNRFLRRVKRIIGNTKQVDNKIHKFQHVVTLLGSYTYYKEETYLGFIKINVPHERQIHCGASMLNNEWVITAAHCLYDKNGKFIATRKWIIYLHGVKRIPNIWERFQAWISKPLNIFGVKKPKDLPFHAHPIWYIDHSQYDNVKFINDIALIQIEPINLNEIYDSGPINLPPIDVSNVGGPNPGETCWYAGWGCTTAKGGVTERLLEAEFQVKDPNVCINTFAGATKETYEKQVCVQAPNTAICPGDSGGGLICKSKNGKMYLAGIASTGASGNNPERYPSNFVKVVKYLNWIKKVTGLTTY